MSETKTKLEEHVEELIRYLELYTAKIKSARARGNLHYTDSTVQRWENRLKAAKTLYEGL